MRQLPEILGEQRIDASDPIALIIHLACPRLEFTDRGKTMLTLPPVIADALNRAVRDVTKEWKRAKRQADQQDRVRARELSELRKEQRRQEWSIKEAAYAVMRRAYMQASADNTLPANAHQVMYAARPLVLSLTNGKCWKDSNYFTQHLLPDYIDEHPDETKDWDVVFDARGHLAEPHTGRTIDLGTLGVRRYVADWSHQVDETIDDLTLDYTVPTSGPTHRYQYALFVEKEGFNELLKQARIAERYDLAIMSTKGMSVTAARKLTERLTLMGVTILVLHDFDKAGFSIVHTLRTDTRRHRYRITPRMIDLGLRLGDVQAMDLQSEPVEYDGKVDPRINLRESGATDDECRYLVRSRYAPWHGQRVELNAMDSAQFIAWLTKKLDQHGVSKIVPTGADLERAYRRAWKIATVQASVDRALASVQDVAIALPDDLCSQIDTAIAGTDLAWDEVLWALVQKQRNT